MIRWLDEVDPKDYDAAEAYLSLRLSPEAAKQLVRALRKAPVETRRANDILRACDREPLGTEDPGVRRTLAKAVDGKKLSPVLVVSFDFGADVADGYHRVSAQYGLDPFAEVPCKIAALEAR